MITSMVQLLCRTTKLCWYDDDAFRTVVDDAKAFLAKGSTGSPVRAQAFPPWADPRRATPPACHASVGCCCAWPPPGARCRGRRMQGADDWMASLWWMLPWRHAGGGTTQGHYMLGLKTLNMLVTSSASPHC